MHGEANTSDIQRNLSRMLSPDFPLQTIPHVQVYLRSVDTRGLKELVFGKVNVFLRTPSLQQLTDVWAQAVRERDREK